MENELDFNADDYNGFYYTNDKQIRKMDDQLVLDAMTERYPDLTPDSGENLLRQVFMAISADSRFITETIRKFDITAHELFCIIYRKYSFLFNPCYISRIKKLVTGRSYAKTQRRSSAKKPQGAGKAAGKRASRKRKA